MTLRKYKLADIKVKTESSKSDEQQQNTSSQDNTEKESTETGNQKDKSKTNKEDTGTGNEKKPTGNTGDTLPPKPSPEPNQPPKNPEPSPEQVNNAKEKLSQAKTEKEIEDALKETQDMTKNSSDADLKKEKEKKERELGKQNKQKLREIIREEVKNTLQENGIKADDLSPNVKQKYDELNNNNNNNNNVEPTQAQAMRTEIFNDVGVKTLTKLISEVEQALKSGDKKKIENVAQKLQEFANSQIDYKKQAYQTQKDKVQQLLEKAKKQQSQQKDKNDAFFRPNNPVMWISGVAVMGAIIGAAALIVRSRQRKKEVK